MVGTEPSLLSCTFGGPGCWKRLRMVRKWEMAQNHSHAVRIPLLDCVQRRHRLVAVRTLVVEKYNDVDCRLLGTEPMSRRREGLPVFNVTPVASRRGFKEVLIYNQPRHNEGTGDENRG